MENENKPVDNQRLKPENPPVNEPASTDPQPKSEGQPEKKTEPPTGKGPKPVGPNQETWDNPEPSQETKKQIDEQMAKLNKLHENPNAQDPALADLNKKQDIESRNADPEHDKKNENKTQQNFDPRNTKTEPPEH
jgi:hypothetical protein